MKMRRLLIGVAILSLLVPDKIWAWGQKGHDVITYIAECHLTPKAKKAVRQVLGGHSMMYYSSWMDNMVSVPEYASVRTWHYANVDEGESYETMEKCPTGDICTALPEIIEKLKSRELSDSLETLYVKFLIHLVGDVHQPMHAGRLSDRGGNEFHVKWFGTPTNLHSLWDTALIESLRKWSYTEWQQNIDIASEKEIAEMAKGSVMDWFNQTVNLGKTIYLNVEEDGNYSYDYMLENYPIVEQQFLRAGYRLARLLNEIYG